MSDREKPTMDEITTLTRLISSKPELLKDLHIHVSRLVRLADHLISNGVTVQKWIPVSERLPDNEKTVQVCVAIKSNGKTIRRKIVQAFHTDGKTPVCASAYSWEYNDGCEEWSDEQNDFVVSEAWWESVIYSDEFSIISDFVTHWRELPEPPKECE